MNRDMKTIWRSVKKLNRKKKYRNWLDRVRDKMIRPEDTKTK